MNEQQNTYYHYQGFVYGPTNGRMPRGQMLQVYRREEFKSECLSLPKYKWTGPPLEDWREMIEGKDFKIDTWRPQTEDEYNEAIRERATELNNPYRKKELFAYPITN